MLHGKERFEFLSDLDFVFGGNGVQDLAFEMHDAEFGSSRASARNAKLETATVTTPTTRTETVTLVLLYAPLRRGRAPAWKNYPKVRASTH